MNVYDTVKITFKNLKIKALKLFAVFFTLVSLMPTTQNFATKNLLLPY